MIDAPSAGSVPDTRSRPPRVGARLLSLLVRPTAPPLWPGIAVAASFVIAETLLVHLLMHVAPGNTYGAIYLLGVLVVSGLWGFGLAVTTTVASTLAYVYVHFGVEGSFIPTRVEDWVAILVFLPLALLANILAGQARLRTAEADQRRREAEVSRDELRRLAELQAALRRVATLVARAVPSAELLSAVAEELARCLGVDHAALVRYESDGAAVVLAAHDAPPSKRMRVGKRFSFPRQSVATMVLHSHRAARMDSYDVAGPDAKYISDLGLHSGVGAPIVVAGRLWGAAIVGSRRPEPLPADTESRVGDFADLVATAIANADTRSELIDSRVRIVAAADDARRRLERDLHDGAQQRLVSLGLALRTTEASVAPDMPALREEISDIVEGLTGVAEELQEISRGIHPAILSRGGLGPALKTLARRSPVPVVLNIDVDRRLAESAEVAAYYVVAEALTNVAKHAQASEVHVSVMAEDANLLMSIRDDGIGGVDSRNGSGLVGLTDRVEALGGHLQIDSIAGTGTSLLAAIPFEAR
jgi:signal transduction histidine kinase